MRYIDYKVIKMFIRHMNSCGDDYKFIDSREEEFFMQLASETSAFVSTQVVDGDCYEWNGDTEMLSDFYNDVYIPVIRPLYKENRTLMNEIIRMHQTDVRSVVVINHERPEEILKDVKMKDICPEETEKNRDSQ